MIIISFQFYNKLRRQYEMPVNAAEACILASVVTAQKLNSMAFVVPTITGRTAIQLSLIAPEAIILTISTNSEVARQLQNYRGIVSVMIISIYIMVDKRLNVTIFGNTDISNPKIIDQTPNRRRRSPLIITIDDPNITPVDIHKMMEIGMNAVRFKASHSTRGDKIRLLGKVDKAAQFLCKKHAVMDWPVATCVELKTCIVKTGILEQEQDFIFVKEGSEVTLIYNLTEYDKCNSSRIFVDNPNIATDIKIGTEISLGHEEIILICSAILSENSIRCVVTKGGKLMSLSIVCARGSKRTRPYITRKDLQIVKFALEYQVDMIIINYVRNVETIRKIKQYMGTKIKKRPIIICGICTGEGLQNVDDIIRESDGIVFSREFLAYELEAAISRRMMKIQKWVGAKCLQAGIPFYISGGIFRGALENGKFLDNESSDVTNALLDGATGFVLINCPVVEHVLSVIQAMNDLCCTVEPFTNQKTDFWRIISEIKMPINAAEACALSCATVANQCNARVVVIPTVTGRSTKILMWLRPSCLVITVSTKTGSTRLLQTYRCVVPLLYKGGGLKKWHKAMESRVHFAVEYAVKRGWLIYGDTYVTLQRGSEDSAFCDCVRIWKVSISKKALVECLDDEELEAAKEY